MPLLQSVVAGDIMRESPICAGPGDALSDVETLMFEQRISGLPVVDRGRLVGVISRSDVARVQVLMRSMDGQINDALNWHDQADGFSHSPPSECDSFRARLGRLTVKDAMHESVITCNRDTPVEQIASTMLTHHIHRLIVVDGDLPIGIISSLDLVRLLA